MSQVNLLPPEVLQKLKTRRLTILIGAVGAIIVVILVLFWAAQARTVRDLELANRAQQATNGELQGLINDLSDAETLLAEVTASDQMVATALANEISWWSQLRDVQLVIPDFVGLSNFAGTAGIGTLAEGFEVVGSISFSGSAGGPTGAERIARWIGRSNSIVGWANPWLSQMTEGAPYSGYYTFSSTVDLTGEARTARGQGPPQEAAP